MTSQVEACKASKLWIGTNECGELSVSGILLIALSISWAMLCIIGAIRLTYLYNSSLKNTDVGKKMQFFQAWFYSFFHTLVNIATIFLAIGFALQGELIGCAAIGIFYVLMNLFNSQIDVIGDIGKKQGVNNIDFFVFFEYITTTYLAKAVWKVGGHKEFTDVEEQDKSSFCFKNLNNSHRPKVYDFKDIVGIQGAFLSIPVLLTLLVTYVRSVGKASFIATTDTVPITKYDDFELIDLPAISLVLVFVSSLFTPLLGDWETCDKKFGLAIASVFFRSLEILARVSFYAFLVDSTKFMGFLFLFVEILFMWFTMVQSCDNSSASRTNSVSHRLLSSWTNVFFVRYRRVHVDKEFNTENVSLIPFTVDFIRVLLKVSVTIVGYMIIVLPVRDLSEAYWNVSELTSSVLFVVSAASNALLYTSLLVYFLVIRRNNLILEEAEMVKNYWLTLQPCKFLCTPKVVHLNRDNVKFEAGGNPIHYV